VLVNTILMTVQTAGKSRVDGTPMYGYATYRYLYKYY